MKSCLAGLAIASLVEVAVAAPLKMAGRARIDLYAEVAVGSLSGGANLITGGSVERMSWISEDEQTRTYVGHWPIQHFSWREVGIRVIPENSGRLHLDLLGPWEWSAADESIFRQEVLWDAVTVQGAALTNGSFEILVDGAPVGWRNPWNGDILVVQEPPAKEGTHSVSTWHDRRIQAVLDVTGGVPVEIRAWAGAAIPDNYEDQPRIFDDDTPAHRASHRFMRGVNLGNVFEAAAGQDWGGGPILAEDLDAIREQGFDHVRIPVRWNAHTGPAPDYAISNAILTQVDSVVTGLLARGMNARVNLHHFEAFYEAPALWTNKLYAIWDQLAVYFEGYPEGLAFEILNEPHDQATTAVMNEVYAHLLPRLRTNHPDRTLFVAPGNWNSSGELTSLRLPATDSNLIVQVHVYEPFLFTHQGATWTGTGKSTTNVVFPGPPPAPVEPHPSASEPWIHDWFHAYNTLPLELNPGSSNAFTSILRIAREWSDYYGRPVHVGEFGAFSTADAVSRARYYREIRETMDRLGIGWAMWDWKAGFYYWDRHQNQPGAGMRDAMFPPPELRWGANGRTVESDAAIGKTLQVEFRRLADSDWETYDPLTLTEPRFSWEHPEDEPDGMIRLRWLQ